MPINKNRKKKEIVEIVKTVKGAKELIDQLNSRSIKLITSG